jgi:hypothetical protein
MRLLIANPCCHIVCLPIAPHILLSVQVHLVTVTHAQQHIASPYMVSSKLPKNSSLIPTGAFWKNWGKI